MSSDEVVIVRERGVYPDDFPATTPCRPILGTDADLYALRIRIRGVSVTPMDEERIARLVPGDMTTLGACTPGALVYIAMGSPPVQVPFEIVRTRGSVAWSDATHRPVPMGNLLPRGTVVEVLSYRRPPGSACTVLVRVTSVPDPQEPGHVAVGDEFQLRGFPIQWTVQGESGTLPDPPPGYEGNPAQYVQGGSDLPEDAEAVFSGDALMEDADEVAPEPRVVGSPFWHRLAPAAQAFVGGVREREVPLTPELQAALTLRRGLPTRPR